MKHLKIFENLKNYNYLDYPYWIDKLKPEESAYVILWAAYKNNFFEVVGAGESIDSEGEESFENTIDLSIDVKNDDSMAVIGTSNISGYHTPFYSATYEQPAEGGDFIMTGADIEDLYFFDIEGNELDLTIPGSYTTEFFKMEDLIGLAIEYAAESISCDDDRRKKYHNPVFPKGLEEKIESIRKQNPEREEYLKGITLLKRFKEK